MMDAKIGEKIEKFNEILSKWQPDFSKEKLRNFPLETKISLMAQQMQIHLERVQSSFEQEFDVRAHEEFLMLAECLWDWLEALSETKSET